MAINDPTAIRFSNEQVRPAADQLARAYYEAQRVLNEWNATLMGDRFPVNGGDVEDGAAVDGRNVITGNDVQLLMARLQELVTDYEASGNAKLNTVLKPAVNYE